MVFPNLPTTYLHLYLLSNKDWLQACTSPQDTVRNRSKKIGRALSWHVKLVCSPSLANLLGSHADHEVYMQGSSTCLHQPSKRLSPGYLHSSICRWLSLMLRAITITNCCSAQAKRKTASGAATFMSGKESRPVTFTSPAECWSFCRRVHVSKRYSGLKRGKYSDDFTS